MVCLDQEGFGHLPWDPGGLRLLYRSCWTLLMPSVQWESHTMGRGRWTQMTLGQRRWQQMPERSACLYITRGQRGSGKCQKEKSVTDKGQKSQRALEGQGMAQYKSSPYPRASGTHQPSRIRYSGRIPKWTRIKFPLPINGTEQKWNSVMETLKKINYAVFLNFCGPK